MIKDKLLSKHMQTPVEVAVIYYMEEKSTSIHEPEAEKSNGLS